MDAIDRFGQELVLAGRRRAGGRQPLRERFGRRFARTSSRRCASAHVRLALLVFVLVLATAAITLAATGVILTGSPVGTVAAPSATAGEGIPVKGGERLLPLRVADPAGGLPWGMRIVHTTRGLVCVQIGRVYHGQLGQLGVDGAFADDGRFHPLPADALPEVLASGGWMAGNCADPGGTYAADSVGIELSASSTLGHHGGGVADRREVSFGLLGVHALSITYRDGAATRTQPVMPALGAYLIVQRYTSGRQLGSTSETDGRDEVRNYSMPAGPNGALTAISYRYGGRLCVDRGNLRMASCGLSEVPPPRPAALPVAHVPLHAHLQIRDHLITGAYISFPAPYAVTNADESYSVFTSVCFGFTGSGSRADVARGGTVTIPVGFALSEACGRPVTFKVEYARFLGGLPQPTRVGTITVRVPRGDRPEPLPKQFVQRYRRSHPTRSLHAKVRLTLLPQTLAACNAAFLLHPCYKGEVEFTAPWASSSAASYSISTIADCKAGGRPESSFGISRTVAAHQPVRTISLGLFVLDPSCASRERFEVDYINQAGRSAAAPHESVIVGTATLSNATLPNGQNPKPPTG
ncbi:MAG: hypothetical protein ACHQCH_08780 [Solirubrobacterales bacterium]